MAAKAAAEAEAKVLAAMATSDDDLADFWHNDSDVADLPDADPPGETDDEDEDDEELWVTQNGLSGPFPPLYRTIIGPPFTVGQHGDNEQTVLSMLDAGADVNVKTEQGWTPLMATASTGQPRLTRLLLRRGADPNAVDNEGNSAIDWALHKVKGHDDDVVLSVEPTAACAECVEILHLARRPWHRANHFTYSMPLRRRVLDLLVLGHALARRPVWADAAEVVQLGRSFIDAWEAHVMPLAIVRDAPDVAAEGAAEASPSAQVVSVT